MRDKSTEIKAKWAVGIYRFGHRLYYSKSKLVKCLTPIYKLLDLVFNKLLLNTEIPAKVQIGDGLAIYHPYGIIINDDAVIGKNCILHHQVTIGNKGVTNKANLAPKIGDNCEIGAGAKVIGNVKIGANTKIGANAVVVKNSLPNAILVGVPAINIKEK